MSYLDLKPFQYLYKKCVAWWLQSGEGGSVNDSIGQLCDQFAQRAYLGLVARFPDYAAEHNLGTLGLIGRDRKIVRGINEPDAAYAARLKRFLTDHRVRGNPFALHDQLRAYCQEDVQIRTVDQRGNWFTTAYDGTRSVLLDSGTWNWDGTPATNWSRFWVIIYPVGGTSPWAVAAPRWDTVTLWGDHAFGHTSLTFGTTATADQISSVRGIIADWKPAGTTCEWIVIAFDADSFSPTDADTGPDGTYANWHSGAWQTRIQTARYWTGPRGNWTP